MYDITDFDHISLFARFNLQQKRKKIEEGSEGEEKREEGDARFAGPTTEKGGDV